MEQTTKYASIFSNIGEEIEERVEAWLRAHPNIEIISSIFLDESADGEGRGNVEIHYRDARPGVRPPRFRFKRLVITERGSDEQTVNDFLKTLPPEATVFLWPFRMRHAFSYAKCVHVFYSVPSDASDPVADRPVGS